MKRVLIYGIIPTCDILFLSLFPANPGARDHKEVQDMSKYELAVVVSAKLEDDARAEVIEKVKALVTRFGGNVTDVDEWGKRRLAYPIQDNNEGYYVLVNFSAEPTFPQELERMYKISEDVIKFITIKKDK